MQPILERVQIWLHKISDIPKVNIKYQLTPCQDFVLANKVEQKERVLLEVDFDEA